ncbi:MAG: hypothetical protein KBF12_10620 [Sebaldella sp.]|nr:hypothetical protein [Sebaldella sp.]
MGAKYELPLALKRRLLKLMTEEEITDRISKHSEASRVYVEMELEGFELKEEEILLIRDSYIQYQLFADVEMETLVEDKRVFLRDLISNIKKNKLRLQNENKEKARRMEVF